MKGRPIDGDTVTVAAWLAGARERLAAVATAPPDTAGRRADTGAAESGDDAAREVAAEAEQLLLHVSGRSRTSLFAWPDAAIGAADLTRLERLLERRLTGEPLAYVIGSREFWSLDFEVDPGVLVPRADTETLVERALRALPRLPPGPVVDAGTGSGAVAVALARECERDVVAIERHASALRVARRNAQRHLSRGRIAFVQGDWLAAIAERRVALLVSNPPYLAADDPHLPALAREPHAALVAGTDGLDAIRTLIGQAARRVLPGGAVLIEHGFSQGAAVRELFAMHGYTDISTARDLAGHERVGEARVPGAPSR